MDKLVVQSNGPLKGTVRTSGSKNSALPILAATLLTPELCTIHNVPDLSDIRYMLDILKFLGAEVDWDRATGTVRVKAEKIHSNAPYELVRKMRASICILGPLVARCKQAKIALPGGCVIGDRPVDIHLKGLHDLGAQVDVVEGDITAEATDLVGKEIFLGGKFGSTVLGTDNILMAATHARGTTVIESAACEPEVQDLANFINAMGGSVRGHGTRRIEVAGGRPLHGAEHTVIPDRIEAGTFIIAALISRGDVRVEKMDPAHLTAVLDTLRTHGANLEVGADFVHVHPNGIVQAMQITTETYPGFPTDMQAQFCALAALSPGTSVVHEKIFPHRFMHISELKRMGAHIELEDATASITGVDHLSGAPVMASDLRASAALVIAGLVARGKTEVNRVYHIDRGYEKIDAKLGALGAKIKRVAGE